MNADLVIDAQSMENLIKSSFSHVESLNSKVFRGNYDILSPTGEIILPEVWEAAIRPGWVVELRLWELTRVGETGQKAFGIAVMVNSPAIPDSPTSSKKSHMEVSPGVQLVTAKRRASLRTWLGSRKSTPSIAVE